MIYLFFLAMYICGYYSGKHVTVQRCMKMLELVKGSGYKLGFDAGFKEGSDK